MRQFIAILATVFCACSCGTNTKPVTKLFNAGNIRIQKYSIDPSKDTTLLGRRGGYFTIKKGTFAENIKIEVRIKEVYTPAEILYAGLVTESDGRLLESGGMIFFDAISEGKHIAPQLPIEISIPTNKIDANMQLFNGYEQPDNSINWTDPVSLDTIVPKTNSDSGMQLFSSYCSTCHSIFSDLTGPALAGVENRVHNKDLLASFIRNPAKIIEANNYFACQKQKFGSVMPGFALTDHQIGLLLNYIKNEELTHSDKMKARPLIDFSDTSSYPKDCTSATEAPCGLDTTYLDTSRVEEDNMMPLYNEATNFDSLDSQYKPYETLEELQRTKGFTDLLNTSGRYNFKIKTLGWFNVDAFYDAVKGTSIVDLFVKVNSSEKELDVHVFFPAKKMLTVGILHEEDKLFHFEKYMGQIPLFLNDEAVAFAVTSNGEKIRYGLTRFNVRTSQTIVIDIKEISQERLMDAFKSLKLDGIDLDLITKQRIIIPKKCFETDARDSL